MGKFAVTAGHLAHLRLLIVDSPDLFYGLETLGSESLVLKYKVDDSYRFEEPSTLTTTFRRLWLEGLPLSIYCFDMLEFITLANPMICALALIDCNDINKLLSDLLITATTESDSGSSSSDSGEAKFAAPRKA